MNTAHLFINTFTLPSQAYGIAATNTTPQLFIALNLFAMYLFAHTHSHTFKSTNAKNSLPTWPQNETPSTSTQTNLHNDLNFSFTHFKYLLSFIQPFSSFTSCRLNSSTFDISPTVYLPLFIFLFWNCHKYWAHKHFILHCNVEGFCCTYTLSQLYWFVFCFFKKSHLHKAQNRAEQSHLGSLDAN